MNSDAARDIARAYLPSRWHYHYAQAKLRSDPLYDGVCTALKDVTAPILDLGCGLGLLAFCLRARGLHQPYRGVDNDAGKIARASAAARNLNEVRFAVSDLAHTFPTHRGSVLLLDVLQYLPPAAQLTLLHHASEALAPGARLVIRTGLADAGWRSHITHGADLFGRFIGWMNTTPKRYPVRAELDAVFAAHGLHARYQPLWGNTPFNNWLIVAGR